MMIYTKVSPIFSSNPGFPLVKITCLRYRERFEIPNTKMTLIKILKPRFEKNENYRNTVNPYAFITWCQNK